MKRLCLITLLMGLFFHANADKYWTPNENLYSTTMTAVCTVEINGVEQTTNIEIGAFCGDELRGSEIISDEWYAALNHYAAFLTIYGNNGDEITFRLYDHNLSQELNVTCNTTVTYVADETLGFPDPFLISFTAEAANTFNITATANPADGGTVTGAGEYEEGASCSLIATANDGYDFVNWTESGVEVSTNATYTFNVTGDRTLVANFEESVIPGSGSGTEDDPYNVEAAIALQGETSLVWVEGYIVGEVISTTNVNWAGPFTVNTNVAIADSPDCNNIAECLFVQLPSNTVLRTQVNLKDHPENLGRLLSVKGKLTAYFSHAGLKNCPGTVDDFHLQAPDTYTITATANPAAGGTVTGAGEYEEGASCTLVATANDGYEFDSWTKGGAVVSTNATYTFTVTEAADFVANFSVVSGGEYHWSVDEYQYPNTMSMIAILKINGEEMFSNNYEIGAFCGSECRGRERTSDEYYDPEMTPHYYAFLYTHGNDNDQLTFRLYDHSISQEVVATCVSTVTFETNGTIGDPGTPYVIEFVTASTHTITVSADPQAGGSVTGGGEYNHGAQCTLTATANTGYTFINWTLGDQVASTDAEYTFEVTGDATYVAHFTQLPTYTITATANPAAGGTITGAGNYMQGTECQLTATANTGYTFINWTLNSEEVGTDATLTFTVTGAAEYVANFQINSYQITATANPATGGTVSGAGTFEYNAECTLTATPNDGYIFVSWTKSGNVVSNTPNYTFNVTEAGNYVANFEESSDEYYWSVDEYQYPNNMTVIAIIKIDGEEQYNLDLEVGAFNGDECRGRERPTDEYFGPAPLNHYLLFLMTYGNDGDELTFKLYDHGINQELNLICNTTINFLTNETIGDPDNPLVINFTSGIHYDITAIADPEEGGTVSGAGNYAANAQCTLTATANEGYTFMYWSVNDSVVSEQAEYTFNVTESAEYVAFFMLNSYEITVTADPEEGGSVDGGGFINHGATCTLTATANEGYTFINWTKNSQEVSTEPEFSFTVTEEAEYVAHFELNSYEITATVEPASTGTVSGAGTYNHFEECTLTATPATGYHFVNWTLNGEEVSTESSYNFEVSGPADYVAHFAINNYEITVTADPEEGGVVNGGGFMNHFSTCTLTAEANEGYTFINWTKNDQEVSTLAEFSFTVTEEAEYVAHFELNSYQITATANPTVGGSVSGAGAYYHFETCTLTATPATGYHFVNWTQNGEEVGTELTLGFSVTGPAAYVANFEINTYDITVAAEPTEGGIVTGAGTYEHFSTCTLTATANEGYTFINWTLNDEEVGTQTTLTFTVTEAGDYVANFELNSYVITATVNPANTGTVSGAGTYYHFEECTLTATPATGYHFVNWTLNGQEVGTDAEYDFEVNGPANYVANFEINSYEITVAANPAIGGTATGDGIFTHGQSVTLTAVPADQFIFANWSLNGEVLSTDSIYTFNATQEGLFVANFERVMVTQHTEIHEGWNWYSTYIEQDWLNEQDFNGLNMLEESLGTIGKKIVSQTSSTTYYSNFGWMGGLKYITNEASYRIQATATVNTSVTGPVVHPEDHPITLREGWNWLGYPCTESMSIATAFAGLTPSDRDQVKTVDKSAVYYASFGRWMGRLQTIEPGMGLLYQSNSSTDVVFYYPDEPGDVQREESTIDLHWMANRHAYPDNMTILAVVELDDEELNSEQYEVAAFANGECRGSVPLMYVEEMNRYVAFLVLSGDEVTTLNFGLYNSMTNTECFDSETFVIYSNDAILGDPEEPFVINFRGHTGIDEFGSRLTVFPNPVEHGGVVSLGLNYDESEVRVEIINTMGSVVYAETTLRMPACITAPSVSGVYTLRITAEGKDACYRKLIVR